MNTKNTENAEQSIESTIDSAIEPNETLKQPKLRLDRERVLRLQSGVRAGCFFTHHSG